MAECYYNKFGFTGISLFVTAFGFLFFLIYRNSIYLLIQPFIEKRYSDNVRSTLMIWYNISDKKNAGAFWKVIQEIELKNRLRHVDITSAGINFLYMSGIITFFGAFYYFFWVSGCSWKLLLLLIICISSFFSAYKCDIYIENVETLLLRSIDKRKLNKLARRMHFNE
ncbi:hypothetical protein ACFL1R_13120 [Candidatus Latescibacterota bacterium]